MGRSPTVFLLVAAALAGCALQPCPPAATPVPAASGASFLRGRVISADGTKAVEAAEVSLVDAAGEPIAGLARARSDRQGDFVTTTVPPNHAYVMVARYPGQDGQDTVLKALARPGTDGAAYHDLSTASTIVTTAVTQGKTGMPGEFSVAAYDLAVARVNAALAASGAPPLTDTVAILAWLEARKGEDATLKQALDQLQPQVAATEPRAAVEAQAKSEDADPLDGLKPIY